LRASEAGINQTRESMVLLGPHVVNLVRKHGVLLMQVAILASVLSALPVWACYAVRPDGCISVLALACSKSRN
jgi:hypothetical protein